MSDIAQTLRAWRKVQLPTDNARMFDDMESAAAEIDRLRAELLETRRMARDFFRPQADLRHAQWPEWAAAWEAQCPWLRAEDSAVDGEGTK